MLSRRVPSLPPIPYVPCLLRILKSTSANLRISEFHGCLTPRPSKRGINDEKICYSTINPRISATTDPLLSLDKTKLGPKYFVFRSTSTDPYLNLAIEDYILTHSHPESTILYTYVNSPCVVLGRNQNPWLECNLNAVDMGINVKDNKGGVQEEKVLLVRRRSGGGTVFHDGGNLNYSVIAPHDKRWNRSKHAQMVVDAIKNMRDCLPGVTHNRKVRVNERHDIVMEPLGSERRAELKISGSAFKLTRGRALHHGTLLFSSPNLKEISPLLRSPAQAFISAKGAESVRSPVGNLCHTRDIEKRKTRASDLAYRIMGSFWALYNVNVRAAEVGGEAEWENEEIQKGRDELMSKSWRWEQTPAFVFSTHPIPGQENFIPPWKPDEMGLPQEAKVVLRVKNSVIQDAQISLASDSEMANLEEKQVRSRLSGRKLHEVSSDWRRAISESMSHPSKDVLISWLETLLPPFKTQSGRSSCETSLQSAR